MKVYSPSVVMEDIIDKNIKVLGRCRSASEDQGSVPVPHGDDWQNTRALRDVFWGQDQ